MDIKIIILACDFFQIPVKFVDFFLTLVTPMYNAVLNAWALYKLTLNSETAFYLTIVAGGVQIYI